MTDRFDPGRLGDWIVFCDICGRKCYASETVKLTAQTGRGGLVVCRTDADRTDPSLTPYRIPIEKNVPYVRINHTNTENSFPEIDPESMTYTYFLASSQDGAIITSSQDDAKIITGQAVQ